MDLMNFIPGVVDRTGQVLQPGRHDVIISQIKQVTDRQNNLSGVEKTQEELDAKHIDWKDSQKQLAVVFSKPGAGVITERFNTVGFKRYHELEDTEGFFQSSYEEPYAIDDKTGERVVDPERSAKAENIINELFDAAEVETEDGSWIKLVQWDDEGNLIETMKNEKGEPRPPMTTDLLSARLNINVVAKEYGGKQVASEVKNFRRWGYNDNKTVVDMTQKKEETADQPNF